MSGTEKSLLIDYNFNSNFPAKSIFHNNPYNSLGLKEFDLKKRWTGYKGEEYEFLQTQTTKLKTRNEEKQNWINEGRESCAPPPENNQCDVEKEKLANEIQKWLMEFFNNFDIKNTAGIIKRSYNSISKAGNILKESSKLDSEIQTIIENCQKTTQTTLISTTSTAMSPITTTTNRVSSTTSITMSPSSSTSFTCSSTLLFIFFTIFWFI